MTRYIIRRLIGTIPTLFVVSLLIYSILLADSGRARAAVRPEPEDHRRPDPGVPPSLGPRPADPGPVLPLGRRLQPGRRGPRRLHQQPGPAELPAGLPRRRRQRRPPRRPRLLVDERLRPVASLIGARVLPTFILAGVALVIWILIALLTGVLAAVKQYGKADTAITIFNYVGFSFPTFWLGIMLIFVFAAGLKILPAGGMWDARTVPIFGSPSTGRSSARTRSARSLDLGRHLILPVDHARVRQHRRRLAVHPGGDDRLAQPGLRPDGSGQGRLRAERGLPPRAAERAAAGRHQRRPRAAVPVRGRDRDRDDLQLAGHGPRLHPGGQRPTTTRS